MSVLVLILIVGGTLALVGLPLLPSVRTLRTGTDRDALVIQDWYDDERHRTALDVDRRIRGDEEVEIDRVDGDFRLEESQVLDTPISVTGSFEAAAGSTVRAVHAREEVRLCGGVHATGWIHAGRTARIDAGACVTGSLSAAEAVDVAVGGRFERLAAESLRFGRPASPVAEEAAFLVQEPTEVPEDVRWIAWSKAIYDDFDVKSRTWMNGDLIVRGNLRVGLGAVIDGTVKVHGSIEVADNVRITGGLFCDGDVRLGKGCRVDGVVTSGSDMHIDSDTVIGNEDRKVTVTAVRLTIAEGVRVHGVVVATESGSVVAELPSSSNETPTDPSDQ